MMKRTKNAARDITATVRENSAPVAPAAPAVATILDLPSPGIARIALADDSALEARIVATLADRAPETLLGREALVLFEANDPARPIITDLMGPSEGFADQLVLEPEAEEPLDARVDGREVVIQAEKRLELRCGKASIVIDESGKISIKGAHLYNRATGPIRIKGGHVDIN